MDEYGVELFPISSATLPSYTVATVVTLPLEQTKSKVVFTHSSNKYHNIFTKYLFLVVVGHSLIFYYFILTYKKLTSQ